MAGRYLMDDPDLALEHAMAAGRRGGRIAAVREAAGLAAYEAGDYALALKELRTFRRMTGAEVHLPLMVDCERALGRLDKAVELATSAAADTLEPGQKVELAIVLAGMRRDQGDARGVVDALTIPQLDKNRGFSYSPRLFRAYAEALRGVGRGQESLAWERRAVVAEAALGIGQFAEPEIVDLDDEEETQQSPAEGVDLSGAEQEDDAAADVAAPAGAVTGAPVMGRSAPEGDDRGNAPEDEVEDVLDEGADETDADDPENDLDLDLDDDSDDDSDDDLQDGSEPDLDPDDDVDAEETRGADADD
ncbi:hypothetical protein ACH9EU_11255 [Kocuria sp. M1R5S2]|uniref:hypothetical protein n=1 Tax=Kocuria rhizosphaerae TaxID=3376285 RepID=UPI00379E8F32